MSEQKPNNANGRADAQSSLNVGLGGPVVWEDKQGFIHACDGGLEIMARYKQLMVQDGTGWYLMNPRNLFEAIRIAWLLWRHPDRVAALVGVKQAYMLKHCTPEYESSNADVTGLPKRSVGKSELT